MSNIKSKYRRLLASFKPDERVVINFLDNQDNVTNAVRYLIMKEVKENGYRNLNNIIPANLTEEYFNFDFSTVENKQDELSRNIENNELSITGDTIDEVAPQNNETNIETEKKKIFNSVPNNCFLDPEE